MIEPITTDSPKILGFRLSGKLHDADYQTFIPAVEAGIASVGKIRMLVLFEDFHGWDLHAAWDDLKFGVKHLHDFDRIAMVGDRNWEKWMARLCAPFTQATVRYFDASEVNAARDWLKEGIA